MKGAIIIALVLGAWNWFGIWIGALDTGNDASVVALVVGNVVAGWFLWDTFFNDKED